MFAQLARYDQLLKTSHAFNILDSRGFVGVTERARYFGRMRRWGYKLIAFSVQIILDCVTFCYLMTSILKNRRDFSRKINSNRSLLRNILLDKMPLFRWALLVLVPSCLFISLARQCAQLWLKTRESLGHPLGTVSENIHLAFAKDVLEAAVKKVSLHYSLSLSLMLFYYLALLKFQPLQYLMISHVQGIHIPFPFGWGKRLKDIITCAEISTSCCLDA